MRWSLVVSRWSLAHVISLVIFSLLSSHAIAATSAERAEELFLKGEYQKAIEAADKAMDSDSGKKYELYYLKGLSWLKLEKFAQARKDFEYVLDKYPRSGRALDSYVGIGDAYFLEGNTQGALRSYRSAADAFPDDKNIDIVRQRINDCMTRSVVQPAEKEYDTAKPVVKKKESVNFTAKKKHPRIETPVKEPTIREGGGYFSVQVGSFKSKSNASRLASKLSSKRYSARVESPTSKSDNLYRVKVGRIASKEEAERLAVKLKREGYPTRICQE